VRVLRRKRIASLMMRLCEAVRRGSIPEITRILSGRRMNINKARHYPFSRSQRRKHRCAVHLARALRAAQRLLSVHAPHPASELLEGGERGGGCDANAWLTQADDNKRTALSVAASEGQLEVVSLLLQRGADPNVMDRGNNTPLYDAVYYKHFDVAEMLSEHGAKLLLDENRVATILCFAVMEGNIDLVKALCRFGADINSKDYDSRTALMVRVAPYLTAEDRRKPTVLVHPVCISQT
jgi:hypothetical protein